MNVFISLAVVAGLFAIGIVGGSLGMGWVFGVVLPYLAIALFLGGMVRRVLGWANVPVPFRIPTTCGQQKSLPWIKQAKIDNPSNTLGVICRVALEVLCFRSLLRNTKTKMIEGNRLVHGTELTLWAAAMAFHWSMLIVILRHLRLLLNPVPACVTYLQQADGFLEVGVPVFYATSVVLIAALAFLLLRRLASPQLRYISLLEDYFPLFLLLGIGISGFWLRHIAKTDIFAVKELTAGLTSFSPVVRSTIDPLFYGHLFLVCVLLAYIPFGKLVHMAAAFMSPTRSMANTNRMAYHVNPWDYPVKVHPYDQYEDELRDKMKAAGLPVEKE